MTMGFAWVEPDGITFYAPDASMLASEEFAANYCMRLISGVLWLDRATGELARLDYHYNRMPAEPSGYRDR